jgi:hypothetical protein
VTAGRCPTAGSSHHCFHAGASSRHCLLQAVAPRALAERASLRPGMVGLLVSTHQWSFWIGERSGKCRAAAAALCPKHACAGCQAARYMRAKKGQSAGASACGQNVSSPAAAPASPPAQLLGDDAAACPKPYKLSRLTCAGAAAAAAAAAASTPLLVAGLLAERGAAATAPEVAARGATGCPRRWGDGGALRAARACLAGAAVNLQGAAVRGVSEYSTGGVIRWQ